MMRDLLEFLKACLGGSKSPPPVQDQRPRPWEPPPYCTYFGENTDSIFAVTLFKELAKASDSPYQNIVVCPHAVQVILAMLLPGTYSGVYVGIADLLDFHMSEPYRGLIVSLDAVNVNGALNSVSAVFYDENCCLDSKYLEIVEQLTVVRTRETPIYLNKNEDYRYSDVQHHYTPYKSIQCEFIPVSFRDDLAKATEIINHFGTEKPENRFPDLLDERRPDVTMILLNKVEFSGQWEEPFYPGYTENETFHCADGAKKIVAFMTRKYGFERCYNLRPDSTRPVNIRDPQVVLLDIVGRKFSVMIVLPGEDSGGIAALEKKMTLDSLQYWRQESMLPCHSCGNVTSFSDILSSEGPIKADEFKQEVTLELDEYGIKTAPCTGSLKEPTMLTYPNFVVNRPFLVVIWNEPASVPVYFARIMDPTA
ncbi:alpha-1-antiproteinase-like isoform X2 [Paramacrobiotus metropolitanus]|uniref:alpha-1-antiproteinase-like isoform X2 n=1 Tax=Paramacrobiotus metropolitanus TaxID=2943436 RepID=UPI0024456CD6|nr:alpha-1-antiproteinase-like isoform X2 [Paramacrobiotus metropolitanus]